MELQRLKKMVDKPAKALTSRLANKLILTLSLTVAVFIAALIYLSYSSTTNILKNDFTVNNGNILKFANKGHSGSGMV